MSLEQRAKWFHFETVKFSGRPFSEALQLPHTTCLLLLMNNTHWRETSAYWAISHGNYALQTSMHERKTQRCTWIPDTVSATRNHWDVPTDNPNLNPYSYPILSPCRSHFKCLLKWGKEIARVPVSTGPFSQQCSQSRHILPRHWHKEVVTLHNWSLSKAFP